MGTDVISGSAKAVVVATGNDTMLGGIAKELEIKPPQTSFEKGVNSVSWVLIRFMLVMVPIVLFINGFTKGNPLMHAFLFAISVAVGLTPRDAADAGDDLFCQAAQLPCQKRRSTSKT